MIITQLTGGLGNQLFQYAAAKSLSLHHQAELVLDISSFYRDELPDLEVPRNFELLNFVGIKEKFLKYEPKGENKKLYDRFLPNYKKSTYKEPFYHYDKHFFKSKKNVFLKGGWQSEKYFIRIKDLLHSMLKIDTAIINPILEKAVSFSDGNNVAVHVRRGDYLRKPIILEWHGVMGKEYYTKAFDLLNSKTKIEKVFYFSDDPEWIEKELIPIMPGEIISGDITTNQFQDFYLMSVCKNNIIANSSFSWWAAWLNSNPGKIVVAPKRWFNKGPQDQQDIIPESWFKV